MDREDLIYLFASCLMALGAWRAFGDGYCFLVGGAALMLPPLVSLFNRKGPQK